MAKPIAMLVAAFGLSVTAFASSMAQAPASASGWNGRAAAVYLDSRMDWWLHWPNAARDRDTTCVSCHTAAPYAMARPVLRASLGEREAAAPERQMQAHVVKRVQLWKEVDPFYNDQRSGLPKTSESRGTEAILNALVLASRAIHGRHAQRRLGVAQFPLRTMGIGRRRLLRHRARRARGGHCARVCLQPADSGQGEAAARVSAAQR
jgi:hypothetical protein